MSDTDQIVRRESAILNVFDNQFPTLTDQVINNMFRLARLEQRWPALLLIISGVLLLAITLGLKVSFIVGATTQTLRWEEFITLTLAGAGLMAVGALFHLYQIRSLRKIIQAQQLVGTEIINKQIEVEREVITRDQQHQQQMGQLIILPGGKKMRKRWRRC